MGLIQNAVPLGWNFNPSSRAHRCRYLPIAILGFFTALYLALCQIGVFSSAWDPVFHDGTNRVIHSSFSRALPIPDAVLGTAFYLLEVILLRVGPDDRWRSKPWLACLSGLAAMAVALVSVFLVFLQPTFIHAWCFWCLILAGLSFLLLMKSAPEFLAFLQSGVLISRNEMGVRRWIFNGASDSVSSTLTESRAEQVQFAPFRGMYYPWTLFASLALGILAYILPELFSVEGVGKLTITFCGVIVIATSIFALSEPLRILRWINFAMGSLLFFWFLGQAVGTDRWIAAGIGVGLIGLCIYGGKTNGNYGLFTSQFR